MRAARGLQRSLVYSKQCVIKRESRVLLRVMLCEVGCFAFLVLVGRGTAEMCADGLGPGPGRALRWRLLTVRCCCPCMVGQIPENLARATPELRAWDIGCKREKGAEECVL